MKNLLYRLKEQNIDIDVVNGQIKIQVPDTFNDDSLLGELKANKEELISYIESTRAKNHFTGIRPAREAALYPASYAQKRFFLLNELDKDSTEYNMPQIFKINQKPDVAKFKEAFRKLIERHEVLRTTFVFTNDNVFQKINTGDDISITFLNFNNEKIEEKINDLIKPFDLNNGPLIRMYLVESGESQWYLVADLHHIIADGVSLSLLINDFFNFYNDKQLAPLKIQYKDYAVWQQSEEQKRKRKGQRDFWKKMFENEWSLPQLPFDLNNGEGNKAGRAQVSLSESRTAETLRVIDKEGVTPFMFFLAVLQVLIGKIANREDVVIGVPVAGRDHNDLRDIIGVFINTLAVRCYPEGNKQFDIFLKNVKNVFLECLDNQSYPYEEFVRELKISRDGADNPLYSVLLSYEDFEPAEESTDGLPMEPVDIGLKSAKAPLSFTININNGKINLTLDYNATRFSGEMATKLLDCFSNILDQVTKNSTVLIADVNLLSKAEQLTINQQFIRNTSNYNIEEGIIECFEEQVLTHPDTIAVAFENRSFSYSEISGKVNGLAKLLITRGLQRGQNVAILIDHSPELIIAMLAAMKCGATFVPIDVNWPKNRIKNSLEIISPELILTANEDAISENNEKVLRINYNTLVDSDSFETVTIKPDDNLYIIFTSGSTGKPKGVAVPARGVMNRLYWMNEYFGKESSSSVLQTTRYVYDSAIWQFFWPLINGGKTVIMPKNFKHTAHEVCDLIEKHQVRLVDFVPSVFNTVFENSGTKEDPFRERLDSLRYIIQGGEEISEVNTRKFLSNYPSIKIINLYGPTEASIGCIYHEVEKNAKGKIPIGKPIRNVSYYILDPYGNQLPDGMIGELCLSGICLASGYVNMPELTSKKFVFNNNIDKRIYKTGDLVKRNRDGNLEFLGRIDQQVKIRGYRIELAEIENTMKSFRLFKEVAVKVQEEGSQKWLVAYYVSENIIDKNIITDFLKDSLPSYMVPDFFIRIDQLPLSASGKLDRKSLPPVTNIYDEKIVIPETDTEKKILEIWSKILGLESENISIDANFFALGGHSLAAISLCNKIQVIFNTKVSVKDIFNYNTIRSLSSFVDSSSWMNIDSLEVGVNETNFVI